MTGERRDRASEEFRAAVADVQPLRRRAHVPPPAPKPQPVARFAHADAASVLHESLHGHFPADSVETGEELVYRRPGTSPSVLRKLRQGRYRVEAELDLHGMTVPVARAALEAFFKACAGGQRRCVRIVHGKGQRSGARGPVLKHKVNLWLQRRDDVLAFASTPPVDGGTGAVYVLLARRHQV